MDQLQTLLQEIVANLPVTDGTRTSLAAQVARVQASSVDAGQLEDEIIHGHEQGPVGDALAFTVIRPSFKSIFVAWNGDRLVSGHGYYELQISTLASEAGLLDSRKTSSTWTIFDALAANESTDYYFRIRAVDAGGNVGDWTGWTSQATTTQLSSADGEEMKSSNYAAGSAGWRIAGNGDAEFNNISARGTMQSTTFVAGPGGSGWRITAAGAAEFHSITVRNPTVIGGTITADAVYADEGRMAGVDFPQSPGEGKMEPNNSGDNLVLTASGVGQVQISATAGVLINGNQWTPNINWIGSVGGTNGTTSSTDGHTHSVPYHEHSF